jgi:hypothetical protein
LRACGLAGLRACGLAGLIATGLIACSGGNSGNGNAPAQIAATISVSDISASILDRSGAQVVSSVDSDSISSQQSNLNLKTLSRDVLGLTVNGKIFAYALKSGTERTDISPTSSAIYMILKVRELTQLPDDKLAVAISDIKAHPGFPSFVAYIKRSIESGMPDPLNPQSNYLLLKKMRTIAESLQTSKYAFALTTKKQLFAILNRVSDTLIPSAHAATANEFSCTGPAADICGKKVNADSLEVDNFRAVPYAAYVDKKPDSFWDNGIVWGRSSSLTLGANDFSWNSQISTGSNAKQFIAKTAKSVWNTGRGSEASSLGFQGIGEGSHKVIFQTMGVCRWAWESTTSLIDGTNSPFERMTDAQWAAMGMNVLSLALLTADTVVATGDVNIARTKGVGFLKGKTQIYKGVFSGMYARVKNIKMWLKDNEGKIKAIKRATKFYSALAVALKANSQIDEEARASFENHAKFGELLQNAIGVFDSISSSGELDRTDDNIFTDTLLEAAQKGGVKWLTESVASGSVDALVAKAAQESTDIFADTMFLSQYISNKVWESSGLDDVLEEFYAFSGTGFNLTRAISVLTVLYKNDVVAELFDVALTGAAKTGIQKTFGKQAMKHFNATWKAVDTGWSVGTKFLPAWYDSCVAPESMELDIINGQVSAYGEQKIQIKIEDLTAFTTVLDFNEIDGTPTPLPSSLTLIDGHNYRYTVRGMQDGVLDRSRNGTDAAHRILDGNFLSSTGSLSSRAPQMVWSAIVYRDGIQRFNVINAMLCTVKRPLIDAASFQFGYVRFSGGNGFTTARDIGCADDAAYTTDNVAVPGGVIRNSTQISEIDFTSGWALHSLIGGAGDWPMLVAERADQGFGAPFKEVAERVHQASSQITSISFEFDGFAPTSVARKIKLPINQAIAPAITDLTFTQATTNTTAKLTAVFSTDMQSGYSTTGAYVLKAGKEGYWPDARTFVVEFDSYTPGGQITLVASGFKSVSGQPLAADRVYTFPQKQDVISIIDGRYQKVSNNGLLLSQTAALGDGQYDWACTLDNQTGLLWEVKTNQGVRASTNIFTFYTSTNEVQKVNGANSYSAPTASEIAAPDNAQTYINSANNQFLCGRNNWAMSAPVFLDSANFQHYLPNKLFGTVDAWYWTGGVGFSCPFGGCGSGYTAYGHTFRLRTPCYYGCNAPRNSKANIHLVSRP